MNEEAVWKRRFFLLMLVRLSGVLLIMLGLILAFGDLIVPGGNRLAGLFVSLAGLVEMVLFPAIIRHHWHQP